MGKESKGRGEGLGIFERVLRFWELESGFLAQVMELGFFLSPVQGSRMQNIIFA